MRKTLLALPVLCFFFTFAQEEGRIQRIQNHLEALAVDNPGLSENVKLNINVNSVSLSHLLVAISQVHHVNLTVDPSLQNITMVNNFSEVTVANLLVFLCKQYQLDINFTGNILAIHPYQPPPKIIPEKEIHVTFDALNHRITMDVKGDPLEKVFRKITDVSGQNLLYSRGMETLPLTLYLKETPLEVALEKLAETNNLRYSKSRDGFYLFDQIPENNPGTQRRSIPGRNRDLYYEVLDTTNRLLKVDFVNAPVADIVKEISLDLKLDVYMATPLQEVGKVTLSAKQIYYDDLLTKIFESQATTNIAPKNNPREAYSSQASNRDTYTPQPNTQFNPGQSLPPNPLQFTFKKENDLYFFGTVNQLSVRTLEVVQMMHRSVELLGDPQVGGYRRLAGRTVTGGINYINNGLQSGSTSGNSGQNYTSLRSMNTPSDPFNPYASNAEAIINILPDEVVAGLDIKIDFELNSFLLSGPAAHIQRFKKFIAEIDKPVPVILIEVMLIEVKKTSTVETGISWGIGDEAVETSGGIFPETDMILGAKTVNKIIGGFDGFGSFNIGRVVPEFFATIKALEANGNIKIKSTPKLSTLNGHRANLSIGETTYYVVTSQNFFGSQIPTTSEIRNFQPIDAELAVSIKPLVSGNGQVTLDINVIQSDFDGERIEDDAPPGLTSREFSSIIRMQNQDVAILGGLEEKIKNDAGRGVPVLARIPIIKWLFSQRTREDTKQKLTILIKPTVIY